jgi:uncharacterized protein YndB with AHSA1/START domain
MSALKSITKSVDIDANVNKVFKFLSNPLNWPKWAVVNLKSISERKDGWYEMDTRQGQGQLKMLADKQYGILDHMWRDPQASWIVPARVVQNNTGSTFIITFFKPSVMDNEMFETSSAEVDIELKTLKQVLE